MIKRIFDFFTALLLLVLLGWLLVIVFIIASIDTKSNGFFVQNRVGQFGKMFKIIKIKTMHPKTYTISKWALFLRKYKIDELPQLWNIIVGDMSLVGPRPDIEGYYDKLKGEERKILELKPGITSEAAIKYFDEEYVLKQQKNPQEYNDTIIFPDKVKLNLEYYYHQTLFLDFKIIMKTLTKLL